MSILIKDTTREEREQIIKSSLDYRFRNLVFHGSSRRSGPFGINEGKRTIKLAIIN